MIKRGRYWLSTGTAAHSLAYTIPLLDDRIADLVLPRDLSSSEADKLCAIIQTLVVAPHIPAKTEPADRAGIEPA